MVADGLLTRQRYREVPPRVDYELTERSKELMPVVGALARWGYDWTWSAPRESEEVNVGAILRLAPGLLFPPPSGHGTVELRVDDRPYVLSVTDGGVRISERAAERPDARVTGSEAAWIAALGPEGAVGGLAYEGSRPLADAVLAGFTGAAARAVHAA